MIHSPPPYFSLPPLACSPLRWELEHARSNLLICIVNARCCREAMFMGLSEKRINGVSFEMRLVCFRYFSSIQNAFCMRLYPPISILSKAAYGMVPACHPVKHGRCWLLCCSNFLAVYPACSLPPISLAIVH